jgi:hypothetical protein
MSNAASQQSDGKVGRQIKIYLTVLMSVVTGLLFARSCPKDAQTERAREVVTTPTANTGMQTVQRTPQGEWYWVLPPGQYINGRNESAPDERTVDIYPQRDGSILAELHYTEYGQPETQRIRIYKVSEKSWKGSADQDNPEEHAKLDLIESSPGVYSGEIKWSEKIKGKCYLNTNK